MEKKRLLFSHPVNIYDTPFERELMAHLEKVFVSWDVENPNQPKHEEGYQRYKAMEGKIGMDYYTENVLPDMSGGVLLAFPDGKIPAGIWKEASWLLERGCPVWEIGPDLVVTRLLELDETRRLSVEETRARIRHPDGSRRPY